MKMYTKFLIFKGEKIESSELKNVLGNLGTELTDKELEKLLKILPIDGKVDIKNLETVLGDMGIKLTDQELEDLKENLPVSVDNTVALKTLKDEVKAFTG
ncbi:Hypothetical predicted protein, partial [Lynx pardinus]